jgi:hypothetical protein
LSNSVDGRSGLYNCTWTDISTQITNFCLRNVCSCSV